MCGKSADRIYELIGQLFTRHEEKGDQQRADLIKRVTNWAQTHFTLKENSAKLSGGGESDCQVRLNADQHAINEMLIACRQTQSVEEREKMLVDWFEGVFIASEDHCKSCPWNVHHNQHH